MIIKDLSVPVTLLSKVSIEHKGVKLTWDVSFYNKSTTVTFDGVFRYFNQYVATLSEQQQDELFSLYTKAKSALQTTVDVLSLQHILTRIVRDIYVVVDYENIKKWIRFHRDIRIPSTIKASYAELEISERNQSENNYRLKTYLYAEYVELLNLALATRFMTPIWAEYITMLDTSIEGNDKEEHALGLLARSGLIDTEAYTRLLEYVGTIHIQQKSVNSAIMKGRGTNQIPSWLLSIVLVRKLCIVEMSSMDDTNNVVSVVWKYVNNIIKSIDRKHFGYIRDKDLPRGDDSGDGSPDGKSMIETYKMREANSIGEHAGTSSYAEDPFAIAIHTDPTIPDIYVEYACDLMNDNSAVFDFCPWQFDIVSMIVDPVMSCRSTINIKQKSTVSSFIAAQALLFHWGHKELAILLTAKQVREANGRLIGGIESRNRIPNEYVDKFKKLYPFSQSQGSSRATDRQTNIGCRTTDTLALEMVRCDWKLTCNQFFIDETTLGNHLHSDKIMIVPADIRVLLARFFEQIA
jgi:hypothetical protein